MVFKPYLRVMIIDFRGVMRENKEYMHLRKIFGTSDYTGYVCFSVQQSKPTMRLSPTPLSHSPFPSLLSLRYLPEASLRKKFIVRKF
jgi:hypothetical protein